MNEVLFRYRRNTSPRAVPHSYVKRLFSSNILTVLRYICATISVFLFASNANAHQEGFIGQANETQSRPPLLIALDGKTFVLPKRDPNAELTDPEIQVVHFEYNIELDRFFAHELTYRGYGQVVRYTWMLLRGRSVFGSNGKVFEYAAFPCNEHIFTEKPRAETIEFTGSYTGSVGCFSRAAAADRRVAMVGENSLTIMTEFIGKNGKVFRFGQGYRYGDTSGSRLDALRSDGSRFELGATFDLYEEGVNQRDYASFITRLENNGLFYRGTFPIIDEENSGMGPSVTEILDQFVIREKRIALLIGNDKYGKELGPLKNAIADVKMIGKRLRKLGFDVEIIENADQKTLKSAISRLGDKMIEAGEGSTGLFYYAGHGAQNSKGENYLIPSDATVTKEADLSLQAVLASGVMEQLLFVNGTTGIVIFDACRSIPMRRATRSGVKGFSRLDAPPGVFVAYSTAPGEFAYDGEGDYSPFAKALSVQLARSNIPVELIFREVRRSVAKETNELQVPWDSSSLYSEFLFAPDITKVGKID